MKRKLEYLTDVSKLNDKEMNEKEMYEIRYQFISSPHIKEIILAMNPKAYDENKPEYANAICFFRSISANADEMARLKKQLNTYEKGIEIGNKYKSPYGDHEWQEGYGIWESGFKRGAQWMLEKAVERYSSELDDFINLLGFLKKKTAGLIDKEKSIENFRKAMEE